MRAVIVAVLSLGCTQQSHPERERASDERIVVVEARTAPAQTDVQPPAALKYFDGHNYQDPPAPSWTGKLTAKGPVWVTTREELVDRTGAVLDREVAPEIAVSPDGWKLAYTRGFPSAVYVLDLHGGAPVHATASMHDANQPVFHGANRLVVAGSRTDEIYGVYVVDLGGEARAITNGDLHVGDGLGNSFVPPPARHESMRIVGETLIYDDGVGERRVQVGSPR